MDMGHLYTIGLPLASHAVLPLAVPVNHEEGSIGTIADVCKSAGFLPPSLDDDSLSKAEALPRVAIRVSSEVGSSNGDLKAITFAMLPSEHQAGEKRAVLAALDKHSQWHKTVAALIPKHGIKVSCSSNEERGLVAAHLTLHNDFKLIKLGRDYGFPRGFCVVVDVEKQLLVGQGTFYPKFANDDRNSSFSVKDFGGISRISCFIKYSGSTGIISIIRDDKGEVIGWTGSSKNSCSHRVATDAELSYPGQTVTVFGKYVTGRFLKWCQRRCVYSLGLEVFIHRDQSHGYGYIASGCIVTAVCAGSMSDGRPIYLNPDDMYEACHEAGLPTDRPVAVEGQRSIQSFVESLSNVRDLLTLGMLRCLLRKQCNVELETLHDCLIDSQIVEGFVIRRWKGDVEVEAVKFKIWLYQMVTQVLRPSFASKGALGFTRGMVSLKGSNGAVHPAFSELVEREMKRWCLLPNDATRQLCQWVIYTAAEACLPEGHDQLLWSEDQGMEFPASALMPQKCVARDPSRAYWITLGDHAVQRLIDTMDVAGWNVEEAASAIRL